jgi:hypothetical protein
MALNLLAAAINALNVGTSTNNAPLRAAMLPLAAHIIASERCLIYSLTSDATAVACTHNAIGECNWHEILNKEASA